ncbi:MAG: SCP2 domain-containing protein [Gammaproteobacteria bacterium]
MKTYILSAMETLINGYVSLDPYAATLRQPLFGKIIAIDTHEIPFTLYFEFMPDKVAIRKHHADAHATIHGSLINMARLTRRDNKSAAMSELAIRIEGDTDSAHQFQQFWDSIHIDWTEIIAKIAGDPLAVLFGRGTKIINRALQQAQKTVSSNLSEYLQEEVRLLPPREEIADFMNDVDLLRADLDRLAARIHRLGNQHE